MTEKTQLTFSVETEKLDEERTISGLAAPYGVLTRDGRKYAFAAGAFGELDEDVHLYFNHDQGTPIGRVIDSEDTEAGLRITARISKTPKGDEVYTLLRDGTLNKFSVGILGVETRKEDDVTIWTKADLHEVSVVPRPAFKTAAIERVYSADDADSTNEKETDENLMTETINTEVVELKEKFNDLERKVSVLDRTPAPAVQKFHSGGEALKALASGDQAAKQDFAFTGATSTDADVTRPGWVNRTLALVEENRDVLNLFQRSPLPASGNSIEYPYVKTLTGTVGVQAAEGDDLPYMEVVIDTATAPVKTYGGYSSLSRQAIERSDVSYLDAVVRYQAQQYAKATNKAVRDAVAAATGTSAVAAFDGTSGVAWLRAALKARRAIKAANSQAAVILVSNDIFEGLFSLVDTTGRPLFDINGDGANTLGSADFVAGRFAGLPVVVDDAAADATAWVVGRDAVTVFEQPGAPVRLQDENIINLTKDFSLYGYMAVAVTNAPAIVRLDNTV